jgi:hypothetical protein
MNRLILSYQLKPIFTYHFLDDILAHGLIKLTG